MQHASEEPAHVERPALVASPHGELFCILTEPTGPRSGCGVLLCANGPRGTSTIGRDRYFVRLARALAGTGHVVARFDYHGVGESTGELGPLRLEDPFSEDAAAVLDLLRDAGCTEFALVGKCFGSRTALKLAAERSEVGRLVLLSLPLRDYRPETKSVDRKATELSTFEHLRRAARVRTLANLTDPQARRFYRDVARAKVRVALGRPAGGAGSGREVSPAVTRPMRAVTERGTDVLCIAETEKLAMFRRSVANGELPLRGVEQLHDFAGPFALMRADVQRATVELITDWLQPVRPGA